AGNPVKDVTISAAVWATAYRTGSQGWFPDDSTSPDSKGRWQIKGGTTCDNEDIQRKGLFENAFDRNGNGLLDPGIPLSASSSGKTDALGMAVVALRYPRDRARWVQAELTVTGTVAGTESLARSTFWLSGLASDYVNRDVAPPGLLSPYGQGTTCFAVD
ncbi:MAG: Ig domain-containing protein, partial [Massilia sp.]